MLSPFCFIVNMSIPCLYMTHARRDDAETCVPALSRCSFNIHGKNTIHASMIVFFPWTFSSLLAQKKVPDKGPDRLYRNPLIVRLISLRLAPSSKGVAGLHRSYVSPPLLIRDIKYSINITA